MSEVPHTAQVAQADRPYAEQVGLADILVPVLMNWKLLLVGPLLIGSVALGISFLIPKTYTSRTVFLPPQQQQSAAAAALAQFGALSGLAGAAAGVRTPGDQYVALLQSQAVADRIVDTFDLMRVYESDYRFLARRQLAANSRIGLGRKDGLITVEVDDLEPQRAASIANAYVTELRRLTNEVALTEAQQRRAFLEQQLKLTRDRLAQAQEALQSSGFSQGALKADARAAAEAYARVRAEVSAASIRLQGLRMRLSEGTPEVQQAAMALQSLRAQLEQLERGAAAAERSSDYISKFREFKYQETLFELFARQYEVARVDESREGALIQVIDAAAPAEWKSKPKRASIAMATTVISFGLLLGILVMRHLWAHSGVRPETAAKLARLRTATSPKPQ
jgi:capsule polysaccharide export protein KpsE/RkpR